MRTKLMLLVFVAALAITFIPSAFAQFGGAENPGIQAQADAAQAKADAAAAKAKAEKLAKDLDALKKGGGASSDSSWMWWLLLLIPAGFAVWWFLFRNRGQEQQPVVPEPDNGGEPPAPPAPAPNPNPTPEPEPPAPAPQPEPAAPAEPENPNPNPEPEPTAPEPPAPAPQPEPAAPAEPENTNPPAPAPEPPAPGPAPKPPAPAPNPILDDAAKGDLKRTLSAIAFVCLFAGLSSSSAHAASCFNTAVPVGGASPVPVAIVKESNTIRCNSTQPLTVFDEGGKAVATGTRTVTFTPATSGRYHIRAGRVTISPLVVTDRYGAFLINGSVDLSRNTVSSADATARTQAKQAAVKADAAMSRVATTEKSVGTLSDQIKAIAAAHDRLEERVTALESRSAPRVDLAPLEQRVASLEAELARVKATANTALSTAQQADTKASDALTRYEEMGLARFKTGLFHSKTVVEAVEDAKAKANKQ